MKEIAESQVAIEPLHTLDLPHLLFTAPVGANISALEKLSIPLDV